MELLRHTYSRPILIPSDYEDLGYFLTDKYHLTLYRIEVQWPGPRNSD